MFVLSGDDVRSALTYRACVPLMREAMIALSAGHTAAPPRAFIPMGPGRVFGVMPGALLDEHPVFGAKLLGIFPVPLTTGRSRHQGVIVLFDGRSGEPICLADAEEVTAVRTASASAVATEALALPAASRLAVFGCGTQALAHLAALTTCRSYESIVVWGRDKDKAAAFVDLASSTLDLAVAVASSAEYAARNSDVICTVTAASEPILEGAWVRPGTHVNVVGSSLAGPVEIDERLVSMSRFVVDSRDSALRAAAEFLRAKDRGVIEDDHIVGEIGEVLAGVVPGRRRANEVTVYKSLGHPVQDLAAVRFLAGLSAHPKDRDDCQTPAPIDTSPPNLAPPEPD